MFASFCKKKVLFITTKPIDYIRNAQELRLIKESGASLRLIHSPHKHYLGRILHIYLQLSKVNFLDFDIIFVGFAPQLVLPLYFGKMKKTEVHIVIDFFISMYDTFCLDRRVIPPHSLTGKLMHYMDYKTLQMADAIICDTNAHRQFFLEEFNADHLKVHTLYLEADRNIYHPLTTPRPHELDGKFVVLYFGTGLPLQGTDVVLEAMSQLRDRKDISFFFIGHIKGRRLRKLAENITNLTHIDWLPQSELNTYINYADLCLAGHFNSSIDKAKRTIPGKAYIYEAIEKPMILGNTPANHELFNAPDARYIYVPLGDCSALADAIRQFLEHR